MLFRFLKCVLFFNDDYYTKHLWESSGRQKVIEYTQEAQQFLYLLLIYFPHRI